MQSHDERFDEAEAEVDHAKPWRFREPDAPNPLTVEVTGWETVPTKLGPAECMQGVDRDGKRWSVLVGSVVLVKRLLDGIVEEWNDELKTFVQVGEQGRTEPGEVVSIKYLGDREGAKFDYPDFRVSRKPLTLIEKQRRAQGISTPPSPGEKVVQRDADGDVLVDEITAEDPEGSAPPADDIPF